MSFKVTRLVWGKRIEPPAKKLVVLWLADKCEDDGSRVFFYMKTLAATIGLTHKSAQRYVSALANEGLISATANRHGGAPGTVTHYRVHIDRIAALPPTPKPKADEDGTEPAAVDYAAARVAHRGPTVAAPQGGKGPHQYPGGETPASQTDDIGEVLNIPTHPLPVPYGGNDGDTKANVQQVVTRLRNAGIARARVTDALIETIKLGATCEDLIAAIRTAKEAGDPFAYGVTVSLNRLLAASPSQAGPFSWEEAPQSVVRARGAELGVPEQELDEQWYAYKARVTMADKQRVEA
jgi:hypothetical protein